jgi:hypothetical protein
MTGVEMVNGGGELTRAQALALELVAERDAFFAALDDVEPELLTVPGLVGEWSARELVAHMGYWAGHAAEALHHAEEGRAGEFDVDPPTADERNAKVAEVAASTDFRTVRTREQASVDALLDRLRRAEDAWLDLSVSYGDPIEQILREDGPDHYREHTIDVRAWWAGGEPEEDDLDDLDELENPDAEHPLDIDRLPGAAEPADER